MTSPGPEPLRLTLAANSRQVAKAHTRQKIREAARHLFVERGFDETTTQEVAAMAGVAVGSLFQHGTDKDDLLMLVFEPVITDAIARAGQEAASPDVLVDVTVMFGTVLEAYADMGHSVRASVRAHWFGTGPNAKAVQWHYETFVEQVASRLQQAQAAGRLAEGADMMLLARNLSSLCQGVLLDWAWLGDSFEEAIARLRSGLALQLIPLQTGTPGASE